jgi:hypothetical protein
LNETGYNTIVSEKKSDYCSAEEDNGYMGESDTRLLAKK